MATVKLVADPYPPYQFEENGRIIGIDHDVITESLKVHGIAAETSLHGWDECMAMMADRKADGIFQITRTPERAEQFLFSDRLRTASTLFFKRTGLGVDLDGTAQLAPQLSNLKIGVLSGYSYDPAIDSLSGSCKVERESSEALFGGLLQDEFSLALMDQGVAAYLMKRMRMKEIDSARGYEISRELYVAFQKDMSELAHHFNSGLREIRESGVYGEIHRSYGLSPNK
jgi:polar amino acid transport system substrate-binding protein